MTSYNDTKSSKITKPWPRRYSTTLTPLPSLSQLLLGLVTLPGDTTACSMRTICQSTVRKQLHKHKPCWKASDTLSYPPSCLCQLDPHYRTPPNLASLKCHRLEQHRLQSIAYIKIATTLTRYVWGHVLVIRRWNVISSMHISLIYIGFILSSVVVLSRCMCRVLIRSVIPA